VPTSPLNATACTLAAGQGQRWLNKMKTEIVAIFAAIAVMALGAQPKSQFKLVRTDETEDSHLVIEHYEDKANEIAQLWTADDTRTNRSILIECNRCAIPLISGDSKWIVVNNYWSSNIAEPLLYRRISGVHFELVEKADLDRIAWRYMADKHGFTSNAVFDHAYSEVLCWMGKSNDLLIRLWGYQSGEYSLDDCYCIINAKTLVVATDLSSLSVKPFHIFKKERVGQPTNAPNSSPANAGSKR
jgi:hypothetical protein